MYIGQKRMNWLQRPSAWQEVQAWREKQAEHSASAQANLNAINEALSTAATDLTSGMMEIAAKRAAARLNAEIQAKVGTAASVSSVNLSA